LGQVISRIGQGEIMLHSTGLGQDIACSVCEIYALCWRANPTWGENRTVSGAQRRTEY